jgi:tRNA (cmo5U34)-methyltransferase
MGHHPVGALFDAGADRYTAQRRALVPCFDDLYGTAAAVVGWEGGPVRRVLDLGAGTGLLARAVAQRHPAATFTLVDAAPGMLAEVATVAPALRATTVVADLTDPLPAGPFDAVVSALAIHHLDDAAKRDLFARALAVLRPGGVFVDAEQVLAPTPWLEEQADAAWEGAARQRGASDEDVAAARTRMQADRCATVPDQLGWLRAAGFVHVHCPYRWLRFAVLVGWAPPRPNLAAWCPRRPP